LHA
jgi:hypothetical protein